MKLVVSGLPGCGASTLSLILAKTLNLTLYKGSESFRYLAKQLGAQSNHEETHIIEKEIQPYWGPIYDKYTVWILNNTKKQNLVIDSDIAGFNVGKKHFLCRIFLYSDIQTRVQHFLADNRPATFEDIAEIDAKLAREYKALHNIDFLNLEFVKKIYEIVIDNSSLSISEELLIVYNFLFNKRWISKIKFEQLSLNAQNEDNEFWKLGKSQISKLLDQNNQFKSGIEVLREAMSIFSQEIENLPNHIKKLLAQI